MQLWRYGQPIGILKNRYGLEGVPGKGSMIEVLLTHLEQFRHQIVVPFLNLPAFASTIPPRRSAASPSPSFQRGRSAYGRSRYAGSQPPTPRRRRPYFVFALVVGVIGLMVIAYTILRPLLTPHAMVTLIPRSQVVQNTLSLSAAQMHVSQISATASPQNATGNTSGTIPATKATGILTFLNQATTDVTIQGAVITDKNGIEVSFSGPLLVPMGSNSASATATATAVQAGASGNIPSFDITMPCCAPNQEIVVENATAFTGGTDARPDDKVLQNDIDQAASSLEASQTQQEQAQLATQVQSNERVIAGTMQCQPHVKSDVPIGAQASSVTVTVTVACSEEVYDQAAAQTQATSLLSAQAPAGYALSGQVTVGVLDMTNTNLLQVHAQGRWLYHFSQAQLDQFALLIAGKSQAQARTLLRQQAGILDAHISSSTTLLPSADHIQIQVQPGG